MIVEIDVKEKWEIDDALDKDGDLPFRKRDERLYYFRGEWLSIFPTNPKLRAAVEKQWEKLRPKDDEWKSPEARYTWQFKMFGDDVKMRVIPDGVFVDPVADSLIAAAEAFKRRELAKREANRPLSNNEIRHVNGTVFELYRAEQDGEVYAKRPHNIYIFKIGVSRFGGFEPGTEEKVRVYCESNRPLKANEWRGVVGEWGEVTAAFRWGEVKSGLVSNLGKPCVFAEATNPNVTQYAAIYDGCSIRPGLESIATAMIKWASKPENLPSHIAIVDGRPYVMRDDEARDVMGAARHCVYWPPVLDGCPFAPGQRERVEKWRASQGANPIGENELERLNGTRESIMGAKAHDWDDIPTLSVPGVFDAFHPWAKYTELRTSFVPGSVDRAKRIFARLYQFCDDEGVDATTGKLRTMAINEARHPETGEIVRLREWSGIGGRCFGNNNLGIAVIDNKFTESPLLARCIAYRDHVLKLEKELEELK